jgi:hypothetical protein
MRLETIESLQKKKKQGTNKKKLYQIWKIQKQKA